MTAIFYGVSPAVIALILHSCYRLSKLGMEDWVQWAIAAVCFLVTVILQAEVALLFIGAGVLGILYYGNIFRRPPVSGTFVAVAPLGLSAAAPLAPVATPTILGKLLLFFLKAGSLTFGSGLVIVPFLEQGLVRDYGWLDQRQFLIAVAIGMISPGPVVITATFVGYLVGGFWGSLVSTIGIFLPSFILGARRSAHPGAASCKPECSGFREGRLCGGYRNHPRGMRPAGPDRDRRLADGARWSRVTWRLVPLEGQQPHADRRHSDRRADRLPTSCSRHG